MSLKLKKKPMREMVMVNENEVASAIKDKQMLDENGKQTQRCFVINHLSTLFPDFDSMVELFLRRLLE